MVSAQVSDVVYCAFAEAYAPKFNCFIEGVLVSECIGYYTFKSPFAAIDAGYRAVKYLEDNGCFPNFAEEF